MEKFAESEAQKSRPAGTGEGTGRMEFRLNQVLDSLPYPFYVIDASDYTIKKANPAAHFGPLSETSTCYALTHNRDKPCDSEAHPCPVEEIKKTRRPATVEHVHYDHEGNARNVEVHAFPIFSREGKVSKIIEYVIDITERKKAEDALKWELSVNASLTQLYKPLVSPVTTIESIAGVVLEQGKILTGSRHGYVSTINPATGDNVAHTHTEMLKGQCRITGKNRKIVFPKGKDGLFPALWGHSLNTGEAFYTNSPEKHQASSGIPEGHVPIRRFLSVPVLLADELVGQIALANKDGDYTEREIKGIQRLSEFYALAIQRKRDEKALNKARDDLEQRVEERTAELRQSYNEKEFIRDTFGAYLSDEVATEILKSPGGLKLGGETREVTILVSDLRGFSALTESMNASQIVQIINHYYEIMIPIIIRHEGTIDEFTGDGILAFFGAPRFIPDHPRKAVYCALEMQEAMRDLNKENLASGLPQIEMGIGISTGHLVVGSMGTDKRRKYGAVGSPINLAFRLEKKARPGEILITESVNNNVGNLLQIGSQWNESLKGIGKTAIYRVIGMKQN